MIPTVGSVHVTNGNTVNMRSSPNTNASIITTIYNGTKVIVWNCNNNGWFRVQYNDIYGYVMSKFIAVTNDGGICTVIVSSLNVRNTPSTNASVIFTASINTILRILDSTSVSGWYRVGNANGSGWVKHNSSYFTVSAQPEDASIGYTTYGITNTATPMGFTASYESILLTVPSGTSLPLLPITISNQTWYKTSYGGSMGFLYGNYVTV